MAKRAPKSSRRRFAFLVRSGAQRGLARQFGGLAGFSEEQHRLAEDLAEARAWLEPEEAERQDPIQCGVRMQRQSKGGTKVRP